MWELGHNEGWAPKNWCFPTLELVKTLESPLDCKGIKSVNSKGNQPWIFIEGLMWELQYFGHLMQKAKLFGKNPDAGKDWREQEKGVTEDEKVGWHHWFNAHEFEQIPGYSEGRESLACCSPQGHRVRHNWATEQEQARRPRGRWKWEYSRGAINLFC